MTDHGFLDSPVLRSTMTAKVYPIGDTCVPTAHHVDASLFCLESPADAITRQFLDAFKHQDVNANFPNYVNSVSKVDKLAQIASLFCVESPTEAFDRRLLNASRHHDVNFKVNVPVYSGNATNVDRHGHIASLFCVESQAEATTRRSFEGSKSRHVKVSDHINRAASKQSGSAVLKLCRALKKTVLGKRQSRVVDISFV